MAKIPVRFSFALGPASGTPTGAAVYRFAVYGASPTTPIYTHPDLPSVAVGQGVPDVTVDLDPGAITAKIRTVDKGTGQDLGPMQELQLTVFSSVALAGPIHVTFSL